MFLRHGRMTPIGRLRRPGIAYLTGAIFSMLALAILFHRPRFQQQVGRTHAASNSQKSLMRLMVVGDSISHGLEGDFTWRYRLWEWFNAQKTVVDFVGPYTGTKKPDDQAGKQVVEPPTSSLVLSMDKPDRPYGMNDGGAGYAWGVSRDFDRHHFAVWGRTIAKAKNQIKRVVREQNPDYLLVELGFNDLGWFHGAEDTLQSMKELVDNARAVNPQLKFAIANAPHRTQIEGREDIPVKTDKYNALLADAVKKWTSEDSPIELVEFRENYSCESNSCPAGYDGLHPNTLGEYQIAQAFTKVLHHRYGLGKSILAIPNNLPLRPCIAPLHLQAVETPNATNVTWATAYGAYGYELQTRVVDTNWPDHTFFTLVNKYETRWTVDGRRWEMRVRANCGKNVHSLWSDVVSATQLSRRLRHRTTKVNKK